MINERIQALLHQGSIDFAEYLALVDILQSNSLSELTESGLPIEYAKAFLLKIANFLIGRYQYQNRHVHLISYPYALIVDPANNCPLHCPGCLHNKKFQEKIGPDWPPGILSENQYDYFIDTFGPYASTILFYNWGEPLLNTNTPLFIKKAKSYLLNTSLSSNLSLKFDAEALVLSGLDYMILSIDGATKESYGHYRRGGKFDLAVNNVRRLTEAKEKFNSASPRLSWQFLLFEHNKREIEQAKKLATELGVNEIKFVHPYGVPWEVDLKPATDAKQETYLIDSPRGGTIFHDGTENISPTFSEKFIEKWQDRLLGLDENLFMKRIGKTCQWLYTTLVMDANGRYLPCCYAPRKNSGFTYTFEEKTNKQPNAPFNTASFQFSRKHFVWRSGLEYASGSAPFLKNGQAASYCVACQDRYSSPLVNDFHLKRYLTGLNKLGQLSPDNINTMSSWGNDNNQ